MALEHAPARESIGNYRDGQVRALAGAGVPGMSRAVIPDMQMRRRERPLQQVAQPPGAHCGTCDWPLRYSQATCAKMNSSITPVRPKTLIFTHSASLTL